MILSTEKTIKLLKPGTIWLRKNHGQEQRVYLESLHSKLLRNGRGEVDIITEFGFEHVPVWKFLEDYEFLGWARVKYPELCSDRNLIPLTLDVSFERRPK